MNVPLYWTDSKNEGGSPEGSFPHWFHNKLLRWFPKISVPWYSYFVWSFPTLCQDWSVSNTEMICPSKARSQKTMHLYIKCSGRKLLLHHKDTQPCGESYMVKKKNEDSLPATCNNLPDMWVTHFGSGLFSSKDTDDCSSHWHLD